VSPVAKSRPPAVGQAAESRPDAARPVAVAATHWPAARSVIGPALLAWSEGTRRDLPWRATRDPWAVLVSEFMLQQTQVSRVIPSWTAFMARFPHPAACAAADAGEVIERWAGLGYNRRALNLHRSAVAVCARHDGVVPDELDALLALPGVGRYTARAVLAFAYERDVGVVDTNAARVLARAVVGRPLRPVEVQALADANVVPGRGWAYNQAILDLGASVCTARRPACGRCPLQAVCAWSRRGQGPPDPATGSAGTTGRQSTFAGSDRQGRGRLVSALRIGPLSAARLAPAAGWPDDEARTARAVASLVADGLAVIAPDGTVSLPGVASLVAAGLAVVAPDGTVSRP
jgi:A/G-specific adenine glycosylase